MDDFKDIISENCGHEVWDAIRYEFKEKSDEADNIAEDLDDFDKENRKLQAQIAELESDLKRLRRQKLRKRRPTTIDDIDDDEIIPF